MNDLLKCISRKRLEEIAFGSIRQSAEEGVMLARFALENLQEEGNDGSLVSHVNALLGRHHWTNVIGFISTIKGWVFVTHGYTGLIVIPDEQVEDAQEVVREACPVAYKTYVGVGLFPWIEGWDIPVRASQACYETGAGKAVNALVEVDMVLQDQGWPALCWAYLDVVPGVMICRSTNQNITSHVVRWLPVKVEGM